MLSADYYANARNFAYLKRRRTPTAAARIHAAAVATSRSTGRTLGRERNYRAANPASWRR